MKYKFIRLLLLFSAFLGLCSCSSNEDTGVYSLNATEIEGVKTTFYINQLNTRAVKKANANDIVYLKIEQKKFKKGLDGVGSNDVLLNEIEYLELYSFLMPSNDIFIDLKSFDNQKFSINLESNEKVASLSAYLNKKEINSAYAGQRVELKIKMNDERYQFRNLDFSGTDSYRCSCSLITKQEGVLYSFKMPKGDISIRLNMRMKAEYETYDNCTIKFWHTMGKNNQEKLNAMIDEFNKKYPNIIIEHQAQGGYTDIESRIRKAIPKNEEPTMAFCYADHVAGYGNNTIDLTPYINSTEKILDKDGKDTGEIVGLTAEEKADYIQGFWEEGSQYTREGFYSAPFSKSTEVLFYNASFFKKYNLPLPTKWESDDPNDLTAMWNLCRKIKEINKDITPLGYDSDDNMYITLSAQYGIPYTSIKDGKGSFDFNNAEAKALVKRLKGYYDEKLFITKGTSVDNTYTSTWFKYQQIVMSIGSTDGTSYNVPKQNNGKYEFDVQVAQIPQQNTTRNYTTYKGPSICFFKNSNYSSERVKAAWLFYKFITSPENSAMYAILTGYEPVRTSSYETQQYKDHLAKLGGKDETLYTRVATLTSTPEVRNSYFASPAFKGSTTARQQCGKIIPLVMTENRFVGDFDKKIDEIFVNAYKECQLASETL